jgi:hypothetical protein
MRDFAIKLKSNRGEAKAFGEKTGVYDEAGIGTGWVAALLLGKQPSQSTQLCRDADESHQTDQGYD